MWYKVFALMSVLFLCSCEGMPVVNNCPAWTETGTASLDDTEQTKRWMFRYEENRQRECKN
jgi:hypothetical protein